MTLPNDFRERLPELLDEWAPQRAPEELLDRFVSRMEGAPQRPGWATSERWFPMTERVHLDQARRMALVVRSAPAAGADAGGDLRGRVTPAG